MEKEETMWWMLVIVAVGGGDLQVTEHRFKSLDQCDRRAQRWEQALNPGTYRVGCIETESPRKGG